MDGGAVEVLLAALNVFQTLALAVMADRSRRVRQQDAAQGPRRRRRADPSTTSPDDGA